MPMGSRIVLDRERVEGDRFLVLLACGHWVHTRNPEATRWPCPVIEPVNENHGDQPAALTTDGLPAVLGLWEICEQRAVTNG